MPTADQLQQQIDALLQEDHALKRAVNQARARLAGQVHAGERSLTLLHQRIAAAQAALSRAHAAQVAQVAPRTVTVVAAPPSSHPPATHTTSGASGAHSGDDGEHEGGHDD